MEDLFIKLNEQLSAGRSFAIYAKPGQTNITGLFQTTDVPHVASVFENQGFIFAPFANGEPAFIPSDEAERFTYEIANSGITLPQIKDVPVDASAKANFEALVNHCVAEIESGRFDKLVASRTEKVGTGKSIAEIYATLLYAYPNAFRYCFYHQVTGLWMGATPEQLLKANGTAIKTVALAGTQVFNPDADAVWEKKEQQEQQFVTDYIISQLAGSITNVSVTAPYTFRAGNIVHIKTDISAVLNEGEGLGSVIEKLHPTPAVCGLPKDAARDFLQANEGYNREYYSGFLGELNLKGNTDLFVNLRCMKMHGEEAQLFIGCGITKDSNPEKEFFETVNKSITMRKVL